MKLNAHCAVMKNDDVKVRYDRDIFWETIIAISTTITQPKG